MQFVFKGVFIKDTEIKVWTEKVINRPDFFRVRRNEVFVIAVDDAEKILREITANKHEFDTNFHTANAFNLLGLIYLKKNDRKRAKGLFQQSLDLEQVNNRLSGIATDYANIGLIEFSAGNKEQAVKTFQTALDYALANQDEDLIDIIQSHLNKIQ